MIVTKAYKILGLIRRTFHASCTTTKSKLYLSLVRSQLMYCSQLWRPYLIKDIQILEQVQGRATKYILSNYSSDYKSHLTNLNLLPFMYFYEVNDIMRFKSYQTPSPHFNTHDHVTFLDCSTKSTKHSKLVHANSLIFLIHPDIFIFVDFPGYGMLYLVLI